MSQAPKEIYEFSVFRLEVSERRLSRDGDVVRLADKAFDTLCALIRRHGELVTKDELMSLVWPDSIVEENNLDQKVSALRSVLGQRGRRKEKFIETVRGHGYRFVADVKEVYGPEVEPAENSPVNTVPPDAPDHSGERTSFRQTLRQGNVVAVADWQTRTTKQFEEGSTPDHDNERQIHSAEEVAGKASRLRRLPTSLVAAIAIAILFTLWFAFSRFSSDETVAGKPIESIAVLPLENSSDSPETDYLSDGITESVINHLSQLPGLRVMSRSAVFRYKGKVHDTQTIGRELNVGAVLSGSLKKIGDRIVITVRLDDPGTARQLWGNQFIYGSADILNAQATISREVAANLSRKFTNADIEVLAKPETTRPEVYELYVRGRFFWNKRNKEGVEKAIENFQKAVEIEPEFALGYVGLADSYLFLWDFADGKQSEMLPKARAAVDRALQIDDSLAEAHATSGFIFRLMWRWTDAEAAFRRSVTLNPNYATGRIWFSIYYRNRRDFSQAMKEVEKAGELDPLSPVVGANTAYVHILMNDYESAIQQCRTSMELDPDSPVLHELLGIALLKQGKGNEAVEYIGKAVDLSKGETSRFLTSLGHAYAVTGRDSEAKNILNDLEKRYSQDKANGTNLAGVYAGLGETEKALDWLERDLAARRGWLPEVNWRFAFDGMRTNPRFIALVRQMGLEP